MSSVNDLRYLHFSLGTEEFAIPLLTVKEVIGMPDTTPIPHSPSHFLGIMNLRGQVISVIDLRKKLGVQSKTNEETSVIILDLKPQALGVVVDSVNSVLAVKKDEIMEKPSMDNIKNTEFILGVYNRDGKLVLFIDIAKTLNAEDRNVLNRGATPAAKAA